MNMAIPLIEAAATLGKSYNQTLRLVLTRQLRGERLNGRWYCDRLDVARFSKGVSLVESGEADQPGGGAS